MKSLILNSSKVQAAPIIRKVDIENETGNYIPICAGQNQSDQIIDLAMLQPKFDNFPKELQRHDQWVVWKGKKIPNDPTRPNSKANVNDPYSWGSFNQADAAYSEGGWLGVGFVLTGNGIAGVDLDKCVVDGKPKTEAFQLLASMDAAYIEYSPSGNGLRAFGYASQPITGVRGQLDGLSVELYTKGRYLTLTGHVIKNEPLVAFNGFEQLAEKIRRRPTEDTDSNSSVSSVSSVPSVDEHFVFPASTVPTGIGQRNGAVFELARWLKGKEPNASRERQQAVVKVWHSLNLQVIGTKEFSASWVEFRNAWERVKQPYGATLGECLSNLPPAPEIAALNDYGTKAIHLAQICLALQDRAGSAPFFLSSRIAGQLIGYHFTDAAALLRCFVLEGWLVLVKAGAGNRASRYKLNISGGSNEQTI